MAAYVSQFSAVSAAELGVPEQFNAATYFVDRNVAEGRSARTAIQCGDEQLKLRQVFERMNRFGYALRGTLDVRIEERVVLLMLDRP